MLTPEARMEELVDRLRSQGHRMTPQRMAILEILLKSKEHPTAEQIFKSVKTNFPMTSLATVYKTVSMLKEMGEVLELGFHDECARYDGSPCPHPHLVCIKCKKIVDLDIGDTDELSQQVARRTGYRIESHRFDFYGVCPQCQDDKE